MRIVLGSAHPYIPQIAGGAQTSTHELALELQARGHDVSVLSGLTKSGWTGLRGRSLLKLTRARTVCDQSLGYSVRRAWDPSASIDELIVGDRPDVVLLQSGKPVPIARELLERSIPVVLYLRNVEFDDLGGDPRTLGQVTTIANSAFTADRFNKEFGFCSAIIHPLLRAERYRVDAQRKNVTFINPHPSKGVDIALDVAECCPDIPFVFVEAWTLDESSRQDLKQRLARLPNVTLRPRTRDMREIYRDARIILAPSQWEEAFGRVASEAHVSGIPVIASDCGGLPESVGPGGMLIDRRAPLEDWVKAVRLMWDDDAFYTSVSEAAMHYSRRPAMMRESQIDQLIEILEVEVARHAGSGTSRVN